MKTLAFTVTTTFLVLALALTTFLMLSVVGVDVLGNDCRYSKAVGTTCR